MLKLSKDDFSSQDGKKYGWDELLALAALLRGEGGCPWDRKQTHGSVVPNLREETEEMIAAIETGDSAGLCEELGDLLWQVVFHSRMEEEDGVFTVEDVVDGIVSKLVRRHPHVFGNETASDADDVLGIWKRVKEQEKNSL